MTRSMAKVLGFCLFFSSLAVTLSENALGRALGRSAQQPAQAPRDAVNKADDEKEARLLEPGKAIKRELSGAGSHTYRIRLEAGQFLKAIIEQDGIDVGARLLGPDGKQIMGFDSESRLRGTETVDHVAEAEGDYQLIVQPRQKSAPVGSYEIRIEELRAATDDDRALHEARNLIRRASKLIDAGMYGVALPLVERGQEIRETVLGPEHPDVAAVLGVLSELYFYKGEYAKTESLIQRALAIREKVLGPEHPNVAASLSNLASVHLNKGEYAKAEPLYQRALTIWEKVLGPEHLNVATSLNNLAIVYLKKGEYAKAEPLYQRALAIREKVLGPGHPNVATSLNDLAIVHMNKGEYAKAEPLYQRALAVREKVLGPEHPDVAASLDNLASLHLKKGDYLKAEPLCQRALAVREKVLGPEHPDVAVSLDNFAIVHLNKGEYAMAEQLHQRALAIKEKVLGPKHLDVATTLGNLASLHFRRGDYLKAEPLYQRALAICESALGPEHPQVAFSLSGLALIYSDRGDYLKAESLLLRALAIREKTLGPEHPDVAASLSNLAFIYRYKGDYAKAESHYLRASAIWERAVGPDNYDLAVCINGLANLYFYKGDYEKAEQLYQRALTMKEKVLGPEHRSVATALNNLGKIYVNNGDFTKAESLYLRSLAILDKVIGPEHPYFVLSLDDLAMLYAAKGDFAQAVTVQARANSISESILALNLGAGSERQKLAYLAIFSKETEFTLSLHSRALPHDPQALDLAFTTLLRRKGRGLEAMADTIGALRRHAAPEDQALFDQLAEARSQLAVFMLKESGTDESETYRARLESLEDRVEELESSLSARSADFREQSQPVTLAAVQSALPAGSALVEFAVYTPRDPRNENNKLPPRYLAYLLTAQGRPKWTDLGEAASIDRAIISWRQALRDPRRRDVKRLARAVDEKVMRPVLALAQSELGEFRRLLIAPDGQLNLVPFAALVDRQGRYLVERYSISYLTSGRDLLRPPVRRPDNQDTVIVADPDYDAAVDVIAARSQDVGLPPELSGAWRIKLPGVAARSRDVGLPTGLPQSAGSNFNQARIYFPPLKGTAGEARALKTILPQATVFTREQATEAALKQLHSPGILHVATHGFFLRDQELRLIGARDLSVATVQSMGPSNQPIENPLLRSGLALAGVNLRLGRADRGDDGVLTAFEAAGLDLWGTKLVVLSACDTGVGEVRNGEGVFGLRRALSLAGSETQVMSLWPVSDLGTRDLMIEYYKSLERGEGRGDGLRRVQLEMIKRKGRRHPFYWASFIQSGEWANLEGKR
jgi:CHAT domain-containing protein/Tfp pilus assembly protein PilF